MSHLDLAKFNILQRKIHFYLELINMVLTLFILLYVSQLKTKQKTTTTTKQTSNTLRMYMLVYYQFNTCSALYHHLLSQSLIIIRKICKAPTLRLKALNKRSITRTMCIEMEMFSAVKKIYT